MPANLKFGIRLPAIHQVDMKQLQAYVEKIEELGFESIWVGDHVYHPVDVLQPLELLTWVAAQTTRVRLGTAVMLTSYLNPVLLAKAAASLDYISGGRLQLGISIGGTPAEYASIGVPVDQRVGRMLENVAIMRALWLGDDVSYAGRYNQIEGGKINPKPIQKPGVPLYFGANTEAMVRRLARHADGWVGSAGSPARFLELLPTFNTAVVAAGRDLSSVYVSKLQGVSIHANHDKAVELADAQWKSYYGPRFDVNAATIHGTPDEVAAGIAQFRGAETSELVLALELPSLDLGLLELLRETTLRV